MHKKIQCSTEEASKLPQADWLASNCLVQAVNQTQDNQIDYNNHNHNYVHAGANVARG